jgi:hypothetical protein
VYPRRISVGKNKNRLIAVVRTTGKNRIINAISVLRAGHRIINGHTGTRTIYVTDVLLTRLL